MIEDEIEALGKELKKLLEEHLPEDPQIARPHMLRVGEIKRTIEAYGYPVRWKADLDPETYKLRIDVEIFQPKSYMTDEQAKLYDKWFLGER